jgi:hypothetical protein
MSGTMRRSAFAKQSRSVRITTAILVSNCMDADELSSLVKKSGPVCILCYERDHLHCHRRSIAEIIEDRDSVRIENLAAPQL